MAAVSVLMVGTGEYTTGYTGRASQSDKRAGVVALVMMDLRARGRVGRLLLCGTDGRKLPAIRAHMKEQIEDVYGLSTSLETFPRDDEVDREAYKTALATCQPGDVAIVFTPDDTHYDIAMACLQSGLHVLVTKPIVKTLQEHRELQGKASEAGLILAVEVHKRWDPIYTDARDRLQRLGHFSYLTSYMSQPKYQVELSIKTSSSSSPSARHLQSLGGQEQRHLLLPQRPPHRLPRVVRWTQFPAGYRVRCRLDGCGQRPRSRRGGHHHTDSALGEPRGFG